MKAALLIASSLIASSLIASSLAALLARAPASGAMSEPAAPRDPPDSRIELKQALSEKEPATFARRLSGLLGMEVRLPRRLLTPLTLPAGMWTAEDLLGQVAWQIGETTGVPGAWRRVFVFKAGIKQSGEALCRLPSAGTVTLHKDDAPFNRIAGLVARAVGCRVKMPEQVPGRYSLRCANLPAERALADLASRANLSLSCVLVFEFHIPRRARGMTEEEWVIGEQLRLQEEGSREVLAELALAGSVRAATGMDPLDPEFDWQGASPQVWARLGFSREGLLRFWEWSREQIENRRQVEALSWEMLSGNPAQIDDGDPPP